MAKAPRGRRAEKQKKAEADTISVKSTDFIPTKASEPASESKEQLTAPQEVTPFFGLVDSTELEYFKQAESTLNINAFENADERLGFISSVFEESKGKELKLATNQICSKLFERLILSANSKQVKQLFRAFNGHFTSLCNQKYSSHVMETFLVRCASMIEKEILKDGTEQEDEDEDEDDDDQAFVSMENVFLFMLAELKPSLKTMMSHQYSSHVLRVMLLILAGKQMPSSVESNSILRSKKSKIARKMIDIKDNEDYKRAYQIPSAFKEELSDVLRIMIRGQDSASLRELAIDKISSPVLQMLIQLEGLVDKDRAFWCMTFAKSDEPKNSKEESFVEYLLSDPVGSHFFETAMSTQRMKNIERLYNFYMKDRILKLAKRETTGVFVVRMLLKKLKPADQKQILDDLVPALNELIVNNLEIGSSIIDCSIERNDYLKNDIIAKFFQFFNRSIGEDSSETEERNQILENVLRLSTSTLGNTKDDWPTADERRRSLFAEKLISYDKQFLEASLEGLIALPEERLIQMCKHGVFSHVVESCLDVKRSDILLRKRFLNIIGSHIVDLSCNAQGSHIVDKLWFFTIKLNMYKDRMAKSLFEEKEKVKNSMYGKQVWKNWSMEMYSRRYGDWKRVIKDLELEYFPPTEPEVKKDLKETRTGGLGGDKQSKNRPAPSGHRIGEVHSDRKRNFEQFNYDDINVIEQETKKLKNKGRNRT
ncbi:hypothetical protein CANARDRAFT_27502 [[Candida] arabinofermentans NRRL YB-2248]|uniref:Nucleolar protein 9 n=1 Tax=[Candida] arabinofermentans NRRL YB-2248 TaxID=983967 RepID=A0A1E4T3C5_9ASCO|nr:hypothetical protein CANARDRAFT_27502 [[Candida] arabinofermentans NRRL YB-2248]